jgi:hypothetical protein
MSKSKSGKRDDAVAGLRVENRGKGSSNSGRDDDRTDDDDNDDVGGGSTDDDGTPDQGSGDAPGTPGSNGGSTDDDGTPDQGSGDARHAWQQSAVRRTTMALRTRAAAMRPARLAATAVRRTTMALRTRAAAMHRARLAAMVASTDDDGTPDQGSGDAPGHAWQQWRLDRMTTAHRTRAAATRRARLEATGGSTNDDGTPDQGSGDAPAGLSVVSLDFGSLFGGTPPAGPVASLPDLSELFPMGLMPDFSGIFFG